MKNRSIETKDIITVYVCYDINGKQVSEGVLAADGKAIDLPDHGSISFLLPNGMYLSVTTSEWGEAFLGPKPVTH